MKECFIKISNKSVTISYNSKLITIFESYLKTKVMNNIGTTSFIGNKKAIIATVIFAVLVIALVVYGLSIK